jgi:uncharacterized protein YdeI (YjbR/CyaY-like superfamily)
VALIERHAASAAALLYAASMAAVRVDPDRVFEFENEKRFYTWLGKHWDEQPEVWIKIHKLRSGLPSITPAQAIDVVLCWGWIDAIRKGFDDQSFLQRYTPRGKKSIWSKINVANVERLTKAGLMQPPGLAQVQAAKADGRWDKAYRMTDAPPDDLLAAIRAEPKAQKMYDSLTAQNRFALTFRTLSLKTEAGRKKKIASFVEMLKRGETIYPNGKAGVSRPSTS